ncbi:MAG: tetratricopeptide repeat protein [Chitinophagales bacterium]|nr:tetratricopeptide repeat protein [Chitinophagales bacterium]MDW8392761.1 tetratricopeptide repeat protein [Chitinophagales bacterium]
MTPSRSNVSSPFAWLSRSAQVFIRPYPSSFLVVATALALYVNTLHHGFVLDDGIVLSKNKYVQRGLDGIPDLIGRDSFHGSIGTSELLSGGRYRPLSLMIFALEVELFGLNAFVHHLFQVLWYGAVCLLALLWLRRMLFPAHPALALTAAMLFAVHPVHTEVVANIKSRDELLSLFFLLAAHMRLNKEALSGQLPVLSSVWFFLALLSKENGIIFLVLSPLWLMGVMKLPLRKTAGYAAAHWFAAGLYLVLRLNATPWNTPPVTEVMDNPYLLANTEQKLATIAVVFLNYLRLLVFPHPLTYDYSYQQIPYASFDQPVVWGSVLLHALLVFVAVRMRNNQPVLSWCIAFYLLTLVLVSNLFFNVGAPMAERFLFQASLPFAAAVVLAFSIIPVKFFPSKPIVHTTGWAALALLLFAASWATVRRNAVWKDNNTLLLHDVRLSVKSGRANTYAGIASISVGDAAGDEEKSRHYLQAVHYLQTALAIQDSYLPALLNLGVAYSRLDSLEQAERYWRRVRELQPENQTVKKYFGYLFNTYYQKGLAAGVRRHYDSAVVWLTRAVQVDSANAEAWYHLGGAQYESGRIADAVSSFDRCLQLQPDHALAAQGAAAARLRLHQHR